MLLFVFQGRASYPYGSLVTASTGGEGSFREHSLTNLMEHPSAFTPNTNPNTNNNFGNNNNFNTNNNTNNNTNTNSVAVAAVFSDSHSDNQEGNQDKYGNGNGNDYQGVFDTRSHSTLGVFKGRKAHGQVCDYYK